MMFCRGVQFIIRGFQKALYRSCNLQLMEISLVFGQKDSAPTTEQIVFFEALYEAFGSVDVL
jgi:hypothetical protein